MIQDESRRAPSLGAHRRARSPCCLLNRAWPFTADAGLNNFDSRHNESVPATLAAILTDLAALALTQ